MQNEPTHTRLEKGRYHLRYCGTECNNCSHPLDMDDRFCPNCAQANSTKKLSVKDFFDEFFASLISYDSKLLKTLSVLLLGPGKITRDYIDGKRVSYTNLFRLLLSMSISYFLMRNCNLGSSRSIADKYGSDANGSFFDESGNCTFGASMISRLPFMIFFFLPIFALFIWLVYIRKKYNYTDHLVFIFHIQSLLFILLIVSLLIGSIFNVFSGWVVVLFFMAYRYKAMRRFYRQGRFKTIVKYAFFNFIFIILAAFPVVIVAVGSAYTH